MAELQYWIALDFKCVPNQVATECTVYMKEIDERSTVILLRHLLVRIVAAPYNVNLKTSQC